MRAGEGGIFVSRRALCRISLTWRNCLALSSRRTRASCAVIVADAGRNAGGGLVVTGGEEGGFGTYARLGGRRGGRLLRSVDW